MSKINWTPIIIGAGILTIGGIVWAFYLKKKRESEPEPEPGSLAVFYVSEDDLNAAQLVKNARPRAVLIRGKNLGEGGTFEEAIAQLQGYDSVVSIGGQITNPLYFYVMQQGLLKELLAPGDLEAKKLKTENGKEIIFAAGYTADNTITAVNLAIALIPLSSTQSGIIKTSAYKTISNKVPCPSC